ncbi:hypothetical protein BJF90_15785 [Pseudonocardia sp. CNS-004]|nr:hypothetical protein BJF90_15785 [Pseudonocardia sp. CNS-004]
MRPMTGAAVNGEGRDSARRKADTLDVLAEESQLWLGTAAVDGIARSSPAAAYARTVAEPIPPAAPVTSATAPVAKPRTSG